MSYRAWELEQFILGQMAEDATWNQLIGAAGQSPATAASCRTVWQSLNDVKQRHLLPGLVDVVEFGKKNTEIRINYSPRFFEAILQSKALDTQPG